jgi:hypothetical protein
LDGFINVLVSVGAEDFSAFGIKMKYGVLV